MTEGLTTANVISKNIEKEINAHIKLKKQEYDEDKKHLAIMVDIKKNIDKLKNRADEMYLGQFSDHIKSSKVFQKSKKSADDYKFLYVN